MRCGYSIWWAKTGSHVVTIIPLFLCKQEGVHEALLGRDTHTYLLVAYMNVLEMHLCPFPETGIFFSTPQLFNYQAH